MSRNNKHRWAVATVVNLGVGTIVVACGLTDHLYVPMNPGSSTGSSGGASSSGGFMGTSSSGGYSDDAGQVMVVNPEAGAPDVAKIACGNATYSDPWSPGYSISSSATNSAQSLVQSMTLTAQANQIRGTSPGTNNSNYSDIFRTPDDTVNNVKGYLFRDGPRGVCLEAPNQQGGVPPHGYSTGFPSASARGAAFDMDLEYQTGAGIGDEVLASGNTMLLAPVINLLRHPGWGRSQETYGEDTFELGRLGTAFTAGARERHQSDAEQSPSHRHSPDGPRVPGVRPFGLVGAPSRDRGGGDRRPPSHRDSRDQCADGYGAAVDVQLRAA